ncbi:DNA-directed RNA polymerase subunit alpha [Candidatus Microgenomates bacterium]|nr:DNA-directed RNA polymerase subunit alpha [Candidatus Microgenomates bacterium]
MTELTFKTKSEVEKADYGKFIISPLSQGYGHTLGNSLRRVLLTSLEGAAVTQIKIKGLKHQFSTIPGVSEDVVEIILNIKKIRLSLDGDEAVKMTFSAHGPGEVKAGEIKTPPRVKIFNKDLVLATLNDKKTKLEIEMTVEKGFGYVSSAEKKKEEMGVVSVDSIFTPVIRVNYKVEETRVGGMTNLDKLTLEIWTDGTVNAFETVKTAAKILVSYFQQIYEPKKAVVDKGLVVASTSEKVLKTTIEELELPTRVTNALNREGVNNLGQLLSLKRSELLRIKNMGAKSISLIEEKLKERELEFNK